MPSLHFHVRFREAGMFWKRLRWLTEERGVFLEKELLCMGKGNREHSLNTTWSSQNVFGLLFPPKPAIMPSDSGMRVQNNWKASEFLPLAKAHFSFYSHTVPLQL